MNNKKSLTLKYIGYLLIVAALTAFDQITKILAVNNLKDKKPFVIWDGVFEFSYVENRGAAFGMQQGRVGIFVIITVILIPLIMFTIHKIDKLISLKKDEINKKGFTLLQIVLVLLMAGAIGNLIDRLANGFVVDFLYFKLIDFPVFNIADCYVTISTISLIFICFFMLSEKELDYIIYSQKRWNSDKDSEKFLEKNSDNEADNTDKINVTEEEDEDK